MNVLQINSWDNFGGAARAAYRLHQAYRAMGLGSRIVVRQQATRDNQVFSSCGDGLLKLIEKRLAGLERSLGWQGVLYPSTFLLPFRRHYRWADVLHLHNLHGEYFSLLALPRLTSSKPTIWTLHDMWAITGHCSYSFGCERWKLGCGACPEFSTPPAISHDATHFMHQVKREVLRRSDLRLVVPSQWLKDYVAASPITAKCECRLIPYGIDLRLFSPHSKTLLRRLHAIPAEQPVIALTAHSPAATYKGPQKLREVLDCLCRTQIRPVLIVFGEPGVLKDYGGRFDIIELGWVQDERLVAQYMAAADLYVMTSTADNAPLSIIEAMACGTPIAAFEVGGIPELVRPPEAGLLAQPGDNEGLARSVHTLLVEKKLRWQMGIEARKIVEREYSIELQAQRYLLLYQEVLENRKSTRRKTGKSL